MSMTLFNKGLRLFRDQANKNWERYAGRDLAGGTVVIVGVGAIGAEIARLCSSFRMRVIGLKRRTEGIDPRSLHLDELFAQDQLSDVLPRAEYLILTAPHTSETEGMIGAEELDLLPRGAVLINIARGALVDEPALVDALRSGQLRGASLDVFAQEPLPEDNPLWTLPNVLISPHSASTVEKENERLTGLFCENLGRYRNGEALLNLFDAESLY
jgi:phosphoglycerate dehydrogenase-like enzyme